MKKLLALLLLCVVAEGAYVVYLRGIISDLIDLNYDKSVYIDGGCQGEFRGSEERLSNEGGK